eukprot:TRINITY_DN8832_c0_g1_i1.p1 TRINITY_DN8832_c0_g1~~TRINITY_DN8832_c0_g1_i1.p1  ORF type:complete len:110 (+),score=18.27 TRINITY_DN8832_c0_g1_i1:16-345(+)
MRCLLLLVVLTIAVTYAQQYTPVFWLNYEDRACGKILGDPIDGSCWKGVGDYEGYYWRFLADETGLVYEVDCDQDSTCTNCYEPFSWGEKIDECLSYQQEFYKYVLRQK